MTRQGRQHPERSGQDPQMQEMAAAPVEMGRHLGIDGMHLDAFRHPRAPAGYDRAMARASVEGTAGGRGSQAALMGTPQFEFGAGLCPRVPPQNHPCLPGCLPGEEGAPTGPPGLEVRGLEQEHGTEEAGESQ